MLTTVGPVMALLAALILVSVLSFTRLTQTLVQERDSELVQLAARQVANHWADSVLLLTEVASTDVVRNGHAEESQALLSASVALLKRFDRISVTDSQGLIVATEGDEKGKNVSALDYFDRARRLRRPVRSPVYEDMHGQAIIMVACPIYDIYGQFGGCVLGAWELLGDRLGSPIANLRVGEHGYAFLVDSYGTVLYHPDKEFVKADYSRHPAVASLLNNEIGAQTVSVGGQTIVVGYAPLPLDEITSSLLADQSWRGWGLLTSELWEDIVAPLQPYVRLMIILLILVITLPLIFLAWNSRRVAAPLQSLAMQAERVASGQFDSQVSINAGPSEVRELELAFNVMVDQLRRYRSDIQNYVVSVLNTQEEERKRIARELHDETAQALIVLGRRIEMAQELSTKPELSAQLDSLRDMVDDTLQGVRRFTSDLRPPLLEELGLPRTLQLLGVRTEREESFSVNVQILGEPRHLLPELELGLYRLAQEGLSNVRRHAHASNVYVRLAYSADAVALDIEDAPTDMADLIKTGRLGLMGIYERARLFGGKAAITSRPGGGTLVRIHVPLTSIVLPIHA
jgi:two-component system sensor histidine kinase UhpB